MRNLYKFTIHTTKEPDIRKVAGRLVESLDGFGTVHAFFRGNVLFVFTDGDGNFFDALRKDAGGKKFLDALAEHATFTPDDPDARALSYRGGSPEAPRERASKEVHA